MGEKEGSDSKKVNWIEVFKWGTAEDGPWP